MGVTDIIQTFFPPLPTRAAVIPPALPYQDNLWPYVNFNGNTYPFGLNQTMAGAKQEEPEGSFEGYARAFKTNGIVFACIAARHRLFTQARFKYRRLAAGRPGDLWGDQSLGILEHPWQNAVTADLLGRVLQDVDLAGNFYATRRRGGIIKRMRPDWVTIVLGSMQDANVSAADLDADVIGYIYYPGGKLSPKGDPVVLMPDEVAHVVEYPDPVRNYVGMSWLTPIVRDVMGDNAATAHKLEFFENGATPNLVVKRSDSLAPEKFKEWVRLINEGHTGRGNAYKTLFFDGGADATVVGANLRQLDFKITQGGGETRIAAAAGVPPIIVGLSEGLQAATYSNYGQARRAFADLWARWMWQNAATSLATIVPPPTGSELWYDDRDIPFLQEDQQDAAVIQQTKAATIRALIDTGFKADDAVKAVEAGDMGLLIGKHTGLFSVQLQAPGSTKMPVGEAPGETPVAEGTGPETPKPGAAKPAGPAGTPGNPSNGKVPA